MGEVDQSPSGEVKNVWSQTSAVAVVFVLNEIKS